jgi:septum site-determining protein MinD
MAKTIVIFSTKGGVGKTLLAVNIAVSLAKDQGKRVCLMDLDLQAPGDMARILNIQPQRTAVDMLNALKKHPDILNKADYLVKSAGLSYLAGVLKPQQSPHFEAQRAKEIFKALEDDFDYIVVDAGKTFSDVFIHILNQANLIILAVTPDILSVYQTKWALDTLQSLFFPIKMIKIVLNRARSMSSISWQEVQVGFPCDIIAQIPSQGKIVGQAINRGIPVVIESPSSKIAQDIKKLTRTLDTDPSLFLEHQEIDKLKAKDVVLDKAAEFWEKEELAEAVPMSAADDEHDEILLLKRRIHTRIIEELNLKRFDLKTFSDQNKAKELRNRAEVMVANFLAEEAGSIVPSQEVRKKLVKEILDEALGLGPLEDLLADPGITDIMVNNKDEIYVERNGKLEPTSKKFISNDQVRTIIERIIAPIGRRIDESIPMVDARLADGSRVNAIIPPLSLTGPTLTIRKFRKERFKIEELIDMNTMNYNISEFMKACVLARKNIIVSGGTGSGKTTILNVLSAFIPGNERIVTIEDAAELRLSQEHWVRLESRSANIEGKGAIPIRDLFRNTLRMRPDRIIIGECRGIEALDMLQAMNTGHDGSLTTVHANATHDVISRLDSMILMSGVELPIRAIREMIASAVDIIVHTARLSDGSRKIMQITEIAGMKDDVHIELKDIFAFKETGIAEDGKVLGRFTATGHIPACYEDIKIKGIVLPEDIFKASL